MQHITVILIIRIKRIIPAHTIPERRDDMSEKNKNPEYPVIIPTAPGANPSSFPDPSVPIDPDAFNVRQGRGDYIDLPSGGHIAPNGAVIEEPASAIPEVLPPNEYTPDKEDLNLLIM